jgi:hypothetical protein
MIRTRRTCAVSCVLSRARTESSFEEITQLGGDDRAACLAKREAGIAGWCFVRRSLPACPRVIRIARRAVMPLPVRIRIVCNLAR